MTTIKAMCLECSVHLCYNEPDTAFSFVLASIAN